MELKQSSYDYSEVLDLIKKASKYMIGSKKRTIWSRKMTRDQFYKTFCSVFDGKRKFCDNNVSIIVNELYSILEQEGVND